MATIKDIASQLGISTSTVSYALNGGPRQVPEPMKQRILDLARELNYRPNRVARSLVTGKTGVLGVVMPPVDQADWGSAHRLLTAIIRQAKEEVLVITAVRDQAPEAFAFGLLDGRIDGCIALTPLHPTVSRMLTEQELAFVAIGATGGLTIDIEPGLNQAVEHLSEMGHARIAFLAGNESNPLFAAQKSVVSKVSAEIGLPLLVIESPSGYLAGRDLINSSERPTGILCYSDEAACGLLQAYSAAGVSAPKEFSVVGFGDTEWALASTPQLTTVRWPLVELATSALVRVKEGGDPLALHTELIVRASTGRPTRAPITLRRFERERFRGLSG